MSGGEGRWEAVSGVRREAPRMLAVMCLVVVGKAFLFPLVARWWLVVGSRCLVRSASWTRTWVTGVARVSSMAGHLLPGLVPTKEHDSRFRMAAPRSLTACSRDVRGGRCRQCPVIRCLSAVRGDPLVPALVAIPPDGGPRGWCLGYARWCVLCVRLVGIGRGRCMKCPVSYHLNCIPPDAIYHELALLCGQHPEVSASAWPVCPDQVPPPPPC